MYAVKACRSCCHRFHMHLLSHMLWGFLLQLMRANSRQLLSLCWSSLTKSLCSSPGTPQAEPPLGVYDGLPVSTVSEQARRSM